MTARGKKTRKEKWRKIYCPHKHVNMKSLHFLSATVYRQHFNLVTCVLRAKLVWSTRQMALASPRKVWWGQWFSRVKKLTLKSFLFTAKLYQTRLRTRIDVVWKDRRNKSHRKSCKGRKNVTGTQQPCAGIRVLLCPCTYCPAEEGFGCVGFFPMFTISL